MLKCYDYMRHHSFTTEGLMNCVIITFEHFRTRFTQLTQSEPLFATTTLTTAVLLLYAQTIFMDDIFSGIAQSP